MRRKKKKNSNKILGSNRAFTDSRGQGWGSGITAQIPWQRDQSCPKIWVLHPWNVGRTGGDNAAGEQENCGIGNGEHSLLLWEVFLAPSEDPAKPWMCSSDKDRERHLVKDLVLKPEQLWWAWLRARGGNRRATHSWDRLEIHGVG